MSKAPVASRAPSLLICSACAQVLSKRVHQKAALGLPITGLCKPCYYASIRVERTCCDCGAKVVKCGALRCQPCNNRFLAADAERERRRIELAREGFHRPEVRVRHNRANASIGERKMRWCPVEYRPAYRKLMKRIGAASARAAIQARMTPFERQLSRVLEGKATVANKLVLPTREYDRTLGGVSEMAL